jgi:hypothetical protein
MSLLIYSGLLYLIGISVILALKPDFMFSKDGNWKEFGIGRSRDRYTWMPFWLFAILWAIVSYTIVLVIVSNTGLNNVTNVTQEEAHRDTSENIKDLMSLKKGKNGRKPVSDTSMKKGYYILDTNETMKKGSPQYIYLGPEAPNLHFENDVE